MFDALHPTRNEIMSINEYRDFAILSGHKLMNAAPRARCPVCKRGLAVRAGQTKDNQHFYHDDEDFCPTKDPASRPYLGKAPTRIDLKAIELNRQWLMENLDAVYSKLSSIIPRLAVSEFADLLEEAKRLNVYGYVGFVKEHTPYVLVTLMNFLPSNSYKKQRKFKFVFFYDAGVQNYEDLWIDRGFASDLTSVSYHKNVPQKSKQVDIETSYLTQSSKLLLTPKQREWCLKVL